MNHYYVDGATTHPSQVSNRLSLALSTSVYAVGAASTNSRGEHHAENPGTAYASVRWLTLTLIFAKRGHYPVLAGTHRPRGAAAAARGERAGPSIPIDLYGGPITSTCSIRKPDAVAESRRIQAIGRRSRSAGVEHLPRSGGRSTTSFASHPPNSHNPYAVMTLAGGQDQRVTSQSDQSSEHGLCVITRGCAGRVPPMSCCRRIRYSRDCVAGPHGGYLGSWFNPLSASAIKFCRESKRTLIRLVGQGDPTLPSSCDGDARRLVAAVRCWTRSPASGPVRCVGLRLQHGTTATAGVDLLQRDSARRRLPRRR